MEEKSMKVQRLHGKGESQWSRDDAMAVSGREGLEKRMGEE